MQNLDLNVKLEGVYIKREQEKIIGEDKITHFLSYAESRIKYTLMHTHTPGKRWWRTEEQVRVVGRKISKVYDICL